MKPLRIIAKLLIILLVFSLISCDENIFTDYADDSSDEAQLEAALIYLDDGEYSKAKAILETLDQSDEEVIRALGSAYAGLAGVDVPSLIASVDDIDSSSALEVIGDVIADGKDELSESEINAKLDNINYAITAYTNSNLPQTDSVKSQLCVLYATRIILTIAKGNDDNDPFKFNSDVVGAGSYDVGSINDDLIELQSCLSSFDEDLSDGFQKYYDEISGGNGTVDNAEIIAYLDSI